MSVTVIVANYNQLSTLPVVIQSLASQSVLPSMVVVADDGSSDGTCEWLDALPEGLYPFPIRYTTARHNCYGLTASENRAAFMIPDGRLLFTNADVVHGARSVEAHQEISDDSIAGGVIREVAMPISLSVRWRDVVNLSVFEDEANKHLTDLTNYDYVARDPSVNFYGVWGGNFSVAVSRFLAIDGFNEEYRGLYGGEEADLIQRFRKAGGNVAWAYNSVAYHLAHSAKSYRASAAGNDKYRREYLLCQE